MCCERPDSFIEKHQCKGDKYHTRYSHYQSIVDVYNLCYLRAQYGIHDMNGCCDRYQRNREVNEVRTKR